jgi:DnaJ-class molecular chaperone
MTPCPNCHGTGRLPVLITRLGSWVHQVCAECEGAGVVVGMAMGTAITVGGG